MDAPAGSGPDQPGHSDLGPIDAPVLVCGGTYSNLQALEALLEEARSLAFPPERIIHTGDVVAYCANPAETAGLLRASGAHAIAGNVEESLAAELDDCGCGFAKGSLCDSLAEEWFAYASAHVGRDLRAWMGTLPSQLTFTMAGRRIRVVHGAVTSVNRYMFASLSVDAFAGEFAACGADMIVAGHSGIPFTRPVRGRLWHNSGSLGLPANDGTPRIWFSTLAPERGGIRVAHHALDYDHEAARAAMKQAGLESGYADALVSGVWPSLDILPAAERDATGARLDPGPPCLWESGLRVA